MCEFLVVVARTACALIKIPWRAQEINKTKLRQVIKPKYDLIPSFSLETIAVCKDQRVFNLALVEFCNTNILLL